MECGVCCVVLWCGVFVEKKEKGRWMKGISKDRKCVGVGVKRMER